MGHFCFHDFLFPRTECLWICEYSLPLIYQRTKYRFKGFHIKNKIGQTVQCLMLCTRTIRHELFIVVLLSRHKNDLDAYSLKCILAEIANMFSPLLKKNASNGNLCIQKKIGDQNRYTTNLHQYRANTERKKMNQAVSLRSTSSTSRLILS